LTIDELGSQKCTAEMEEIEVNELLNYKTRKKSTPQSTVNNDWV